MGNSNGKLSSNAMLRTECTQLQYSCSKVFKSDAAMHWMDTPLFVSIILVEGIEELCILDIESTAVFRIALKIV